MSSRHTSQPSQANPASDHYASMHRQFRWLVPEHLNIAYECCTRWAKNPRTQGQTAIIEHAVGGQPATSYTFGQLHQAACALSQDLQSSGVQAGDRVAIIMPQSFASAVAYMAVLQIGAVAMPLSMLFGDEALAYRLQDSGAVCALVHAQVVNTVQGLQADCPALREILSLDADALRRGLQVSRPAFSAAQTRATDPAILIYTSGTTGNPKGALIPQQALLGNLTGFICSQNWFGFDPTLAGNQRKAGNQSQAVFWSPADWAWTGGLMDALLPSLYFGRPIVAFDGRFSPELAFGILQTHRVTHTFLFPTALKSMMKAYPKPSECFNLHLKAIMSAGEAVGDAVFDYCQQELGIVVNEMFGQTEINYILGNCAMNGDTSAVGWPAKAGSMGRAYPGHRVALIDDAGLEVAQGELGEVAVHRRDVHGEPDPVFFLQYWGNAEATAAKFTGSPDNSWCRTGDLATMDSDGYFWYQGRADDMFKAAGYRIGPGEIENCLLKHPAVQNAAVVPKPDKERGALVKAYVVLVAGWQGDAALVAELQLHVRGKLAPYEYPKEIEFIAVLPMTTTGKIQRRMLRLQEQERAAQLG